MPEALLWLYLCCYLGLTWCLAFVLWTAPQARGTDSSFWALSQTGRSWGLALALILAALAGLPPFVFFICKLAALVLLFRLGAWGAALGAFLLLLLGWFVYQTSVLRLVTPVASVPVAQKATPTEALMLAVAVVLVGASFFFFDDLALLALWLVG